MNTQCWRHHHGHRLCRECFQQDVFLSSLVSLEGQAQDAPEAATPQPLPHEKWMVNGFLFSAPVEAHEVM